MASSSNSPCAACKFLRRKCVTGCVFAPYFPPDMPQKFANVHKIFGASNVTKILNDLQLSQREDAVNSLAYEAAARIKDPVHGCVGTIIVLTRLMKELEKEIVLARQALARYMNAGIPIGSQQSLPSSSLHIGMGLPRSSSRDQLMYTRDQQMGLPRSSSRDQLMYTRDQQMYMRDQQMNMIEYTRQETQMTREQLLEVTRLIGDSYENYASMGAAGVLGTFPPSRTGSDGGSGGGGHFAPP